MRTYSIDTIGDNSLKVSVWKGAVSNSVTFEQQLKDDQVFEYKAVHPNLHIDRLIDDVAWLYEHGAKSVKLKQI